MLKPACKRSSVNSNSKGPFNIVFIGSYGLNLNSEKSLSEDINYLLRGKRGLFSIEPFKTYKFRFKVFQVLADNSKISLPSQLDTRRLIKYGKICEKMGFVEPKNTYYVILSDSNFRSHALANFIQRFVLGSKENIAVLSLPNGKARFDSGQLMFVHEMGHSFGGLSDEYVERGFVGANIFFTPNCFKNEAGAIDLWFRRMGLKARDVGYDKQKDEFKYKGCGGVCGKLVTECDRFIRPSKNSIMKKYKGPGGRKFNAPSLKVLTEKLRKG